MTYLFWICFFLLAYTYFLFPVAVILFSKNKKLNSNFYNETEIVPSVSILIAAYNEQAVIKEKVMSIIDSNFPNSKIEIIIIIVLICRSQIKITWFFTIVTIFFHILNLKFTYSLI